jgi:hypothetical protein
MRKPKRRQATAAEAYVNIASRSQIVVTAVQS